MDILAEVTVAESPVQSATIKTLELSIKEGESHAHIVLYCTALCCTVLHCAVPYCTVLCCTVCGLRIMASVLCRVADVEMDAVQSAISAKRVSLFLAVVYQQ